MGEMGGGGTWGGEDRWWGVRFCALLTPVFCGGFFSHNTEEVLAWIPSKKKAALGLLS